MFVFAVLAASEALPVSLTDAAAPSTGAERKKKDQPTMLKYFHFKEDPST